jgi:hypothetical protein
LAPDGRFFVCGSENGAVSLWQLDWELKKKSLADWHEGAECYLDNFLTLHSGGKTILGKWKPPKWDNGQFKQLLSTLGRAGYGWLKPESVKKMLEHKASEWTAPPPLFMK